MLVGPAAEFPPIIGKHCLDRHAVRLEGGRDIIVHQMRCGDRQLERIEPNPSDAGMAINRGLQKDLADTLGVFWGQSAPLVASCQLVCSVCSLCRNTVKPASTRSGHCERGAKTLAVRTRFCS